MKLVIFLLIAFTSSLGFGHSFVELSAEKAEFKVFGACGMCKARIEKAAMDEGVNSATWSQESKILTITYDAQKVNLEDVHQKIADAGHDTEKFRASDETYNSLPACCHYERKETDKTGQSLKPGGSCCSKNL